MSDEVMNNLRKFKLDADVLRFDDTVESVAKASALTGMPTDFIVKICSTS